MCYRIARNQFLNGANFSHNLKRASCVKNKKLVKVYLGGGMGCGVKHVALRDHPGINLFRNFILNRIYNFVKFAPTKSSH